MEVSVYEAKTQFSRLLDLVLAGEEIVIRRHGKPVARLSSVRGESSGAFGAMKGEFDLPEDWDRPLSDEEADLFWQGKW